MSLKSKGYDTDVNALQFHERIVDTWKPKLDVWPFAYGADISGAMSSLSGFNIAYFVRKELKLRPYAKMAHYIPVIGFSAIANVMFQRYVIDGDIIRGASCPLCTTMKAIGGQILLGTIHPIFFAHVIGFYLADRLLTYPVPPLIGAPKELLQLWLKFIRKNQRSVWTFAVIQVLGIMCITYEKQKTFLRLNMLAEKL